MEETVTILMVDDDQVDRMAVSRALRSAGIKMNWSESNNCVQAIALLQQQEFDCVFLDYRLPDGDGLSLVQQIRGLGISTPLVVLTGQGDEQIAVQLMKAGACDYLPKDKISPDTLYQILRQTIRVHRAEMSAAKANQQLRESEERYRLVLEAANDGIWDWYCTTDEVYCNDRLLEIIGLSREEFIPSPAAFTDLMHPEDLPEIRSAINAHLTRGEKCEVEFRIRHKDGEYRYCLGRGKAQRDRFGCPYRMSGVLSDITQRKHSQSEIVKLNRDLERRIDELETLLDVIPIGIAIAQDPECHYIRTNPALAKLLQIPINGNASKSAPPKQAPYKVYREGKEVPAKELPMQYAAASGKDILDLELDVIVDGNSSAVRLLSNAAPLFDEQGKCRGSIGAFVDITQRKQIEEQERFLAEASVILAASLDYQAILKNLAQIVVPQLADWCNIHVVQEDGLLSQVAVAHLDPLKVKWATELEQRYPTNPNDSFGAPQVIRSGQSALYSEVPDSVLYGIARDASHLNSLRQVGIKSLICVPMRARGRTLGAISFATAESDRIYTPADLTLAEDLGRRSGLAVDNARLYSEANEIGENLRQAIMILGEQQQQLRVLQRITNLLNQRLTDLPSLMQIIVGAICDGIGGAEFAMIAIHNPQTDELELTATAGIGRERLLLSEFFEADEGLLKQVFLTGKSKLICQKTGSTATSSQEKNYLNSTQASSPQSLAPSSIYACAIAGATARSMGVLAVGNWHNPDAFDVEDRNLLEAVGEQAAIAINNARLINTLAEREERLEAQNFTLAQQNRELELNRQRIEQQNLQLIQAAKLKSQFLATMSHELRTPMNSIIGFAQVLLRQRKAKLSDSQTDMVERILNNGKNLLTLINDILDLSRIEEGHLELQLEQVNLIKLVWSTVAELKQDADQKQLSLKVYTHLENPIIINDSTRLRQVLINLLSNAIKFTETGSVEVKVNESPTQLLVSVKDTGIGIAESEQEHIFEEFRQVDQTTTRRHGGTGLGLAITKSLVSMMQGKITVESKLGQGSTFCLELPRYVTH